MWPHRPVGRGLMSGGLALLALPTLALDAAAAPAVAAGVEARLLAWHALSTGALAGIAGLALWAPGWPAAAGRAVALAAGVLLALSLALAPAVSVWPGPAAALAGGLPATLVSATLLPALLLFALGARWSMREIRW